MIATPKTRAGFTAALFAAAFLGIFIAAAWGPLSRNIGLLPTLAVLVLGVWACLKFLPRT